MLRCVTARETGSILPSYLVNAETTRRAFSIELSTHFDVQKIHDAAINSLDIDLVEDRYLLSGAGNGTIVIHDLHNITGLPHCTYPEVCHVGRGNRNRHKYSVETVQWYPLDTGMFVSSGMDKLLKVWDTNTMKAADEFQFSAGIYTHHMSSVALQHCLVAVATGSAKVKLLDLKSGSATHTLRGHRQTVFTTMWSTKDEFILATGSRDSKVMLWDIRSAKGAMLVLDQYNGDTSAGPNSVNTAHSGQVNGLCFTSDGLHLVTFGTDHTLRLWSTATGQNTMVNFGRVSNESKRSVKMTICGVSKPALVFVPSVSDILVYDLSSGAKVNTLRGHFNQVNCCIFHHTYQDLYSCGNDRNILIWKPLLDTTLAYDEFLHSNSKSRDERTNSFVRRIGAADSWSSEED